MLLSPLARKGAIEDKMILGDILNSLYRNPVSQTAGGAVAQTLTGEMLAKGDVFIVATTAAQVANLPSAEDICNAIRGNLNKQSHQGSDLYVTQPAVQTQWPAMLAPLTVPISFERILYSRNASGANTLTAVASTGVTIHDLAGAVGGAVAFATNTWNLTEFIIENSTPSVIAAGSTTAASAVFTLSNPAIVDSITPGMSAYLSTDTGWDVLGTKVVEVDRDNGTVTMSDNAASTASLVAVTFTPTVKVVPKATGTIVAAHLV